MPQRRALLPCPHERARPGCPVFPAAALCSSHTRAALPTPARCPPHPRAPRPPPLGARPHSAPAPSLVLASGTAARLRVLRDAGIDPEVVVSGVDETTGDDLGTAAVVELLAERKAVAVAAGHPGALVLGCDSLLDLDGVRFGKPATAEQAAGTWQRLSGQEATLFTGHCLITGSGRRLRGVARAAVRFGTPSDTEVAAYIASGEPMTLAGAFSIEGLGAPFVDSIDGDPGTVLGLSLPLLRRMLAEAGVAITDLWRRPALER